MDVCLKAVTFVRWPTIANKQPYRQGCWWVRSLGQIALNLLQWWKYSEVHRRRFKYKDAPWHVFLRIWSVSSHKWQIWGGQFANTKSPFICTAICDRLVLTTKTWSGTRFFSKPIFCNIAGTPNPIRQNISEFSKLHPTNLTLNQLTSPRAIQVIFFLIYVYHMSDNFFIHRTHRMIWTLVRRSYLVDFVIRRLV